MPTSIDRKTPEETFTDRMRRFRTVRGWSQGLLADWVRVEGVDLRDEIVTRIETGQRSVRLNEAVAIAAALRVPLTDMLAAPKCGSCNDVPPAGFTCQQCGAT